MKLKKVSLGDVISFDLPQFSCEFRWLVFGISDDFYYVRQIYSGVYCKIWRHQDIYIKDNQLILF